MPEIKKTTSQMHFLIYNSLSLSTSSSTYWRTNFAAPQLSSKGAMALLSWHSKSKIFFSFLFFFFLIFTWPRQNCSSSSFSSLLPVSEIHATSSPPFYPLSPSNEFCILPDNPIQTRVSHQLSNTIQVNHNRNQNFILSKHPH